MIFAFSHTCNYPKNLSYITTLIMSLTSLNRVLKWPHSPWEALSVEWDATNDPVEEVVDASSATAISSSSNSSSSSRAMDIIVDNNNHIHSKDVSRLCTWEVTPELSAGDCQLFFRGHIFMPSLEDAPNYDSIYLLLP